MQISASPISIVHSAGGASARRARAASAVAVPCGLKPLQLSSRSSQAARGVSVLPQAAASVRRCGVARTATRDVTTASLEGIFKQTKEHLQWVTIFCTFGSIMAVAAPMAVMGKATLATVASAALGAAAIWLMVEVVGDFIREQRLKKSGEKEAWMNKAREIAAAARARQDLGPTMQAKNWLERNVSGAASEEDAKIIRSMNEFLGVEADK